MTTATGTMIESVMGARSGSTHSEDGWDLEGIPRRFWPRIREILQARTEHVTYSAPSVVVATAMVNALALQSIAKTAGAAGEGIARAAGSLVAEWDGELCPPYKKWPPKKKRFVAEEIVELLSEVLEVTPEGALANGIRSLGGSMTERLNAAR